MPTRIVLTVLALVAFASNSLLTRLALGARLIDAATFTAIRLGSGAIALSVLVRLQGGSFRALRGSGALGPLSLFLYAMPFSFAYVRIGAAAGALVLFGVVQLTMIGYALFRGERPGALTWVGFLLASSGLLILTAPSVAGPDPLGLFLMAVAGVAWAVYSIAGRSSSEPLAANARSFLWGTPLSLLVCVPLHGAVWPSGRGLALAAISGAVTSGLGYAIWYRVLPRWSVAQAGVAQLTVPIIAALGAVALLDERPSVRLLLSGVAVLSGVGLVLVASSRRRV